jgi:hypothetical protein
MTLRLALSKLLPIVLRLCGLDPAMTRHDGIADEFFSPATRRAYITRPRRRSHISQQSHGSQANPWRLR